MSTILQNLCKLSQNIFSSYLLTKSSSSGKLDENNVTALKKLFGQITLNDLNFDLNELQKQQQQNAPITFTSIYENQFFSLTVFGFRHRTSVIPLHDHPGMHGFIKCVHGRLSIKSYSILNHQRVEIPKEILAKVSRYERNCLVPALYLGDEVVSSNDRNKVCTLTPTTGNIHEIRPLTNVAVMADIISPPYTAYTHCYFYHIIDTIFDVKLKQNVTWLLKTMHTDEYYCDTIRYTGDKIIV